MYEVLVERRAEKDLRKLPAETFRRVIRAIRDLARDPRPPGSRKLAGSSADFCVRIGAIMVLRVRHRRDAYRGRS